MLKRLLTIPTMGGRSRFDYSFEKNVLQIRFGKLKNPISVKASLVQSVKRQVRNCRKEPIQKAKFYNKPYWDECPNNMVSPYVAQLVILEII